MAVPTNTIQNVARVGVREDLSNKIAGTVHCLYLVLFLWFVPRTV